MPRRRSATSSASIDPTVNALQERVAELLGQEAALFLPIGDDVQRDRLPPAHPAGRRRGAPATARAHPIIAEAGGPAAFSGRDAQLLDGDGGCFDADALRAAIQPAGDRYGPRSRLVSVEQTTNMGGGRIWPLDAGRTRSSTSAREHGMRAHLDGARLMNAVVASGVPAADWASPLRHRLDRLHQGARRAGGRLPGRLAGADRRGVALQADVGGGDAPGGDRGGRRRSTRSTTTSSAWPRTTPTRACLADGLAEIHGVTIDPRPVETNIVIFEVGRRLRAGRRAVRGGASRSRPSRRPGSGWSRTWTSIARGASGRCPSSARRWPDALDPTPARRRLGHDRAAHEYRTCPLCEATCGLEITMSDGDASSPSAATRTTSSATASSAPRARAQGAARGPRPPAHAAGHARRRARRGDVGRGVRRDRRRLPPILAERPRRGRRVPRQPDRAQPRADALRARAAARRWARRTCSRRARSTRCPSRSLPG